MEGGGGAAARFDCSAIGDTPVQGLNAFEYCDKHRRHPVDLSIKADF